MNKSLIPVATCLVPSLVSEASVADHAGQDDLLGDKDGVEEISSATDSESEKSNRQVRRGKSGLRGVLPRMTIRRLAKD